MRRPRPGGRAAAGSRGAAAAVHPRTAAAAAAPAGRRGWRVRLVVSHGQDSTSRRRDAWAEGEAGRGRTETGQGQNRLERNSCCSISLRKEQRVGQRGRSRAWRSSLFERSPLPPKPKFITKTTYFALPLTAPRASWFPSNSPKGGRERQCRARMRLLSACREWRRHSRTMATLLSHPPTP